MEQDKEAKAQLEDLEVHEVSIVDRPANKRRFLVLKRTNSNTEEEMSEAQEDKAKESADSQASEQTTKLTIGQVKDSLVKAMEKLIKLTKDVDKLGDKDVPEDIYKEAGAIADSMVKAIKEEGVEAKKVDGAILNALTKSVEALMAVINKIKDMEASAEMPEDVINQVKGVASVLLAIAQSQSEPEEQKEESKEEVKEESKEEDEEKQEKSEETKEETKDLQSTFVMKAGAKMSKSRLSQFKKAIETLSGILNELEPQEAEEKKEGVKKNEEQEATEEEVKEETQQESNVEELITKAFSSLQDKLGAKLDDINKRLEAVENTTPAGNAVEAEVKVKKNEPDLWAPILKI